MTASRWIAAALGVWVVLLWWRGLNPFAKSDVKWHLYRRWIFRWKRWRQNRATGNRIYQWDTAPYDWERENPTREEN